MCGISGVVQLGHTLESPVTLVGRMLEAIRHRGPDGNGVSYDGNVAIGMTRLAIIDLQTGDQPIFNEDRTVSVVCNGEIYNYRTLQRKLEAAGHSFRTKSDVEVIVHAYEEYGLDFVRHIDGMFAFAILDSTKRKVVLGRDRLGIKPLFIAENSAGIWFGSEIKTILQSNTVNVDQDLAALDYYLAYSYIPEPLTIYKGVRKFPSGSIAEVGYDGSVQYAKYWRPVRAGINFDSEKEWVGAVSDKLKSAVGSHLVSDVPVGVFLSGGVDSSLVAALAATQSEQPLQAFTVRFEDSGQSFIDESEIASLTARKYGMEHVPLTVSPSVDDIIERIGSAFDEPFADDSVIPSYYLSEATSKHVKVALSGLGGDELFGGYPRHKGIVLQGIYERLPQLLRTGILPRLSGLIPVSNQSSPTADHLKRFIRGGQLSSSLSYRDYLTALDRDARSSLVVDTIGSAVDQRATESWIDEKMRGSGSLLEKALVADLETYLVDDVLALTDRLSMAHSLEVRVPFLDHHFVELALAVPGNLKIRRLRQKYLLNKVAEKFVPPAVLNHRKQGFESPMARWLRGPMKYLLDRCLDDGVIRRQGIFRTSEIARIRDAHDSQSQQHNKTLFALLMYQLWYRENIDRDLYLTT